MRVTQAELYQALKAIGYPVAYSHFVSTPQSRAPAPPFITYRFIDSADVMADGRNYVEISDFAVELYTDTKDQVAEAAVQAKLKELGLPYVKSEAWIDSEKLFQVIYEIQLIGG